MKDLEDINGSWLGTWMVGRFLFLRSSQYVWSPCIISFYWTTAKCKFKFQIFSQVPKNILFNIGLLQFLSVIIRIIRANSRFFSFVWETIRLNKKNIRVKILGFFQSSNNLSNTMFATSESILKNITGLVTWQNMWLDMPNNVET